MVKRVNSQISSQTPPAPASPRVGSSRVRADQQPQPSRVTESQGSKTSVFRHFFAGISWIQILSGGLAAVTVFLLSSKLGLAGTIIGAALASMISTFASQLYQNILKVANSKLTSSTPSSSAAEANSRPQAGAHPQASAHPQAGGRRIVGGTDFESADDDFASHTAVFDPAALGTLAGNSASDPSASAASTLSDTTLMPLSAALDYQNGEGESGTDNLKKNKQKKLAIIISIVVALLSVALVAGGIMLITGGKPTDTVLPSTRNQMSQTPQQNANNSEKKSTDSNTTSDTNKQHKSNESSTDSQSGSSSDEKKSEESTTGTDTSGSNSSNNSSNSTESSNSSNSNSSSNSSNSSSESGSSDSSSNSNSSSDNSATDKDSQNSNSSSQSGENSGSDSTGSGSSSSSRVQK